MTDETSSKIKMVERKFSIIEIVYPQAWDAAQEASNMIQKLSAEGYTVTRTGPVAGQIMSRHANEFLIRLQKEL